jgi:hypothetical protein
MDAGSRNLFRDMSNARNSKLNSETKVGQKSKKILSKKGNYV